MAIPELIGALDQGTTSTRFIVFDPEGTEVARHQLEHAQLLPHPGWVEHDPMEVLERCHQVMAGALEKAGLSADDLAGIGITNQRETTVVWDGGTGLPLLNAIVWQDTRTAALVSSFERAGGGDRARHVTGLPPATYFSAPKLAWALSQVEGLRGAAETGRAKFGTMDSWLIWNLTGGPNGGRHVTDPTNASRTMLMSLADQAWSAEMLAAFDVPAQVLPEIQPSSGPFGTVRVGPLSSASGSGGGDGPGVPILADLGDQHAAMLGQVCTRPGEAKNTYGTGNFLLVNTGPEIRRSAHRLISTICFGLGRGQPCYALEGSVAVTGSAVQWLRDQLGIIASAAESQALAAQVPDTGGAYFVPAFSGLFAPYWRSDARGAIVGLTRATTKAHLARATLESICYQTRDVLDAMARDTGSQPDCLKVDGGVTANDLCMQLQADIIGIPVSKPVVAETTALGAAYAAGLAAGIWSGTDELRRNWREQRRWEPTWGPGRRQEAYAGWRKAVERALGWA